MSTATPTPSATAEPSGAIGTLKKNSLDARGITFLVVSAAAPLTVIAGTVPLAILIAGPAAPTAYLVVGVALAIFAVGFMAMTNRISRTGGFYTYIAAALGKHMGLGAGILALVSYNAMQIGIYGLFAVNAKAMLATVFGIDVPWPVLAGVALVGVWAMGFTGIDIGARVLGVLLVAETIALAVLGVAILVTGAAPRASARASSPPSMSSRRSSRWCWASPSPPSSASSRRCCTGPRRAPPTARSRARPISPSPP